MQNYKVTFKNTAIIIKVANGHVENALRTAHRIAEKNDYDDTDVRIAALTAADAEVESMILPLYSQSGRQLA